MIWTSTPSASIASRTATRSEVEEDHPDQVAVSPDVIGAGVDRGDQVVLRVALAVDQDDAALPKTYATEPGSPRLPPLRSKA